MAKKLTGAIPAERAGNIVANAERGGVVEIGGVRYTGGSGKDPNVQADEGSGMPVPLDTRWG
jgi:hypothetical protein